jgi:hypothetical protein
MNKERRRYDGAWSRKAAGDVQRVAEQRMPGVGHVDADLVCPPRLDANLERHTRHTHARTRAVSHETSRRLWQSIG